MEAKQKTLIHWCGLLGVVSFLSYAIAVAFAPSAYLGYDWMSQAVSDLSAANAPSLALWHQLSSLYGVAGMVCIMMVCVAIQGKWSKILRLGIYVFAAMFWVSTIGYAMFPISESGGAGVAFQDTMHTVVTALVVPLSILAFVFVMIGGYGKKRFVSLAVCASVALFFMFVGGIGAGVAPSEYFGIFQRFSNLVSVNGFLAILGIYLFMGRIEERNDG